MQKNESIVDTRVHISVEVTDLHTSIQFYQQLFQREPTKVKADYAHFQVDAPVLHLALVTPSMDRPDPLEASTLGSAHLALVERCLRL